MKKTLYLIPTLIALASCGYTTISYDTMSTITSPKGQGQVVYHWEREGTGVEKFSRDHNECMKIGEGIRWTPNFKNWFISEENRLEIRADWHSEKGVWASYVPYPGAQPLVVNSLWDNKDIDPKRYRLCMEDRGYWHRTYNLPTITNIFVYKPQTIPNDVLFDGAGY